MRTLLAGLFVFFGMLAVVILLSEVPEKEPPVWIIGSVTVVSFFVLLVAASLIFNVRSHRFMPSRAEDFIKELEEKDLITQQDFKAIRAFQIEEFEDEGSHYMVELENGSVLYLNGQYLYDYEMIDDDPELNQPRTFPCTEFTIRRHKTEGFVVDIICRGELIEPECTAPSFSKKDFKQGLILEDGQIITDKSYDELKAERAK